MQNIAEEQDIPINQIPKTQAAKSITKITNNRHLNQNIYNMFLQKRYDQCINLIDKCKADQFKLYIRSLIEKNRYRLQKSMDLLNQCLVMNKLNYSYLKCIAKNYYLLGKYKPSLAAAKDAYKINGNDYEIFYILGKISLAFGDKATALTNFKSSVAKEPNEQSYIEQAKIHMSNLQFLQAIELLKESINISNQNPQLYQLLGLCFSKMGRNELAFQNYKKTLEVDADKYNALIGLGTLSLEREEVQEALQAFKKAYKTSANSAVLWNNVGIAMFKKKKLVAAYCCFKRALFLDPFRWDIHSNLALIFINKGKFLPAQIHLRSALKINQDSVLFNLLGICLAELKDYLNAEKCFQQAQKLQLQNEQYRFNILMCSFKRGDKTKSKRLYEQMSRKCNNSLVREKLLSLKTSIEDLR